MFGKRMAIIKLALAAVFLIWAAGTARAQSQHPCAADAISKAQLILKLHYGARPGETIENLSIGGSVKTLAPVKALKGNGKLDVLEVWGSIYKADYRMRFIYARIKNTCALMGQEILEASNPY